MKVFTTKKDASRIKGPGLDEVVSVEPFLGVHKYTFLSPPGPEADHQSKDSSEAIHSWQQQQGVQMPSTAAPNNLQEQDYLRRSCRDGGVVATILLADGDQWRRLEWQRKEI
ncbi:hypothetical protein V6N13_028349 [Hibiscus sabdariffa]